MKKRTAGILSAAAMTIAMCTTLEAAVPSVSVCGIRMDDRTTMVDGTSVSGVTGSAVFDPVKGTLTLDSFRCGAGNIVFSGDLHIILKGTNELVTADSGITLSGGSGNVRITGIGETPSLSITSGGAGICTYSGGMSGSVSIEGVNLSVTAGGDGMDSGRAVTVSGSTVTVVSDYDGIEVETEGLSITDSEIVIVSKEDGFDVDGTASETYSVEIRGSTVDITCTVGQNSGYGIDYDTNTLNISDSSVRITSQTGVFSPESPAPVLGSAAMFLNSGASAEIVPVSGADSYGDVNRDGQFNAADGTALAQYFAGYGVPVDKTAADIDGDGAVTRRDSMILSRYLAGWKGYFLPVKHR